MADPVTRLNPPSLPDASAVGTSQVSVAEPGRLASVSGQIPVPPGSGPVPRSLAGQAAQVAANLGAALGPRPPQPRRPAGQKSIGPAPETT